MSQRANSVVLGAKQFAPNGKGFGKAHPKTVYNGGVPNGLVRKVRWRNWGAVSSYGRGRGSQYKPGGGYYPKSVGVRFRAYDIGRCGGSQRPAYTQLQARIQNKPGGHFGEWFDRSGATSICKLEFQARSASRSQRCGDIPRFIVSNIRTKRFGCEQAREIAKRYVKRGKCYREGCDVLRFNCRKNDKGYESYEAVCRDGSRRVRFFYGA